MENLTCKELVSIWLLTDEVARTSEKNSPQQKFHKELSEKLWKVYEKRITTKQD